MKQIIRGLGAAVVAAVIFLPRATEAEVVEDYERMGEYDGDSESQRFQSVAIKGELVAASGAPGGWTLLRTYANESADPVHVVLEERVTEQETSREARVSSTPQVVLSRMQKIDLAPHQKKSVGVYLPESITTELTRSAKIKAGGGARSYHTFDVTYLRALAPGETAPKPVAETYDAVLRRARMPAPPPLERTIREDDSGKDLF